MKIEDIEKIYAAGGHLPIDAARALAVFKAYVHRRLDEMGVPHDPEPEENAKHGCRIDGRLNYVFGAADFDSLEHFGNVVCGMLWDAERQREWQKTHALCAWCGHDGLRLPDEMQRHAEQCEKHPMHALRMESEDRLIRLESIGIERDTAQRHASLSMQAELRLTAERDEALKQADIWKQMRNAEAKAVENCQREVERLRGVLQKTLTEIAVSIAFFNRDIGTLREPQMVFDINRALVGTDEMIRAALKGP